MKALTIGGHNVRRGFYLMRVDCLPDWDGEPVRYFPKRRAGYLWRLVDRFNRMQARSVGPTEQRWAARAEELVTIFEVDHPAASGSMRSA